MKTVERNRYDCEKIFETRTLTFEPFPYDEIVVQLAGTFAADRFIVIKNKTKDPVVSAAPHPDFDYERKVFTKDGREEYMKEYATQRLHNDIKNLSSS